MSERANDKHPMQPVHIDPHGVVRFKSNAIVRHLLDVATERGIADMNSLAVGDFTQDDREQFAQLIGYSVCGFNELSYVSDATYRMADRRRQKALDALLGGGKS
jgi:hypothetical protein